MGEPIRSRLLDFVENARPGRTSANQSTGPEPLRSSLFGLVEAAPAERPLADRRPGPKPGVPPYRTAVFVPAHPRYVEAVNAEGRPVRVPYIAYEHPAHGTVAFAFSALDKLVAALGEAQPWAAVSLGPLAEGVAVYCMAPATS